MIRKVFHYLWLGMFPPPIPEAPRSHASWRCPKCGTYNGSGIKYCEGLLLDDEDGGDTRHRPVRNPNFAGQS